MKIMPVKILRPSLDDYKRETVLRGIISPDTLECLRVDAAYQREGLSVANRKQIARAFEGNGRLPDIVLGMRGDRFQVEEEDSVTLVDPVYIIDGQQRRNTALEYIAKYPAEKIRLGATVHFNTNIETERELFHALNLYQTKVSPSVILRNLKDESDLMATLYGLTKTDREFALYGRVCWSHHTVKSDLLTGLSYTQISLGVHAHLAAVLRSSTKEIIASASNLSRAIGLPAARSNVKEFWNFVDACWGIRDLQYRDRATHLRTGFLRALTKFLSGHHDFWDGDREQRFSVPYDLRKKIATFPIGDREIIRLAGTGGQGPEMLRLLLIEHVNSGKRTRRLSPRDGVIAELADDDDEIAA